MNNALITGITGQDGAYLAELLLLKGYEVREAKELSKTTFEVWETVTPKREFLHVDHLGKSCLHLMNSYEGNVYVNIGAEKVISIKELALLIKEIVGFNGEIVWNTKKIDGTPRKLLDVSLIHSLGWQHTIELKEGITKVYRETFLK